MRRSVPNWLTSSACCAPFGCSNSSAGPPLFTVPVDDLGHLEVGIDLRLDADELALALEEGDPVAKIAKSHGRRV